MSHPESAGDDPESLDPGVVHGPAARGKEHQGGTFRALLVSKLERMLPDPEELARYEQHFPGLGHKIVNWTEEEQLHRRSLERRSVDGAFRLAGRGQLLAFLWAAGALAAAVALGFAGKNASAIAALAAALAPVLLALAHTVMRRRHDNER